MAEPLPIPLRARLPGIATHATLILGAAAVATAIPSSAGPALVRYGLPVGVAVLSAPWWQPERRRMSPGERARDPQLRVVPTWVAPAGAIVAAGALSLQIGIARLLGAPSAARLGIEALRYALAVGIGWGLGNLTVRSLMRVAGAIAHRHLPPARARRLYRLIAGEDPPGARAVPERAPPDRTT